MQKNIWIIELSFVCFMNFLEQIYMYHVWKVLFAYVFDFHVMLILHGFVVHAAIFCKIRKGDAKSLLLDDVWNLRPIYVTYVYCKWLI